MPKHPLAEVFGFPVDNMSSEADRYRRNRLCPFNNKVPSCTKDKAKDPLGVCSMFDGDNIVITCPVRFRQDWMIADDAAQFFFPQGTSWTSLTEVQLNDKNGKSAGNIDIVLVSYDSTGKVTDFGALEVQAVYISGNIRDPFAFYMQDPASRFDMNWKGQVNYPRPDYLSSSRKRLAPQLIYKGGILNTWNKKTAVAIHRGFYNSLPALPRVAAQEADIAWMLYDMEHDARQNRYNLVRYDTAYTQFKPALDRITTSEAGDVNLFIKGLQTRLDKLDKGSSPDAPTLADTNES